MTSEKILIEISKLSNEELEAEYIRCGKKIIKLIQTNKEILSENIDVIVEDGMKIEESEEFKNFVKLSKYLSLIEWEEAQRARITRLYKAFPQIKNLIESEMNSLLENLTSFSKDKEMIKAQETKMKSIIADILFDRLNANHFMKSLLEIKQSSNMDTNRIKIFTSESRNIFRLSEIFIHAIANNKEMFEQTILELDKEKLVYKKRFDEMTGNKLRSDKEQMYLDIIAEQELLMKIHGTRSQRASMTAAVLSWGLKQNPKKYLTNSARQIANNISKLQNKGNLPKN